MASYLYVDSDNYVTLTGLQDASDDSYINDATVVMSIYDEDGTVVTGTITIAMAYTAASNGNYTGTFPNTVSLTEFSHYEVYVAIVSSDGTLKLKTQKEYIAILHPSP